MVAAVSSSPIPPFFPASPTSSPELLVPDENQVAALVQKILSATHENKRSTELAERAKAEQAMREKNISIVPVKEVISAISISNVAATVLAGEQKKVDICLPQKVEQPLQEQRKVPEMEKKLAEPKEQHPPVVAKKETVEQSEGKKGITRISMEEAKKKVLEELEKFWKGYGQKLGWIKEKIVKTYLSSFKSDVAHCSKEEVLIAQLKQLEETVEKFRNKKNQEETAAVTAIVTAFDLLIARLKA